MTAKEQEGLDYVLKEIQALREMMLERIVEENILLEKIRMLFEIHGTNELIRVRVEFVNILMAREVDRIRLRKAIIEKSLLGAVFAILAFVAVSVQHELVAYFRK